MPSLTKSTEVQQQGMAHGFVEHSAIGKGYDLRAARRGRHGLRSNTTNKHA